LFFCTQRRKGITEYTGLLGRIDKTIKTRFLAGWGARGSKSIFETKSEDVFGCSFVPLSASMFCEENLLLFFCTQRREGATEYTGLLGRIDKTIKTRFLAGWGVRGSKSIRNQ
jgi:hypothetical protein